MHRASTDDRKVEMYGKEVVEQYTILDHDCRIMIVWRALEKQKEDPCLCQSPFYFAGSEDCTGLVESHFFTGISGGRKAIALAWWM